jgi:stage V sporulation protein G
MDENTTTAAAPLKLDVSVRTIEPKNNLLAFASVTINDSFKAHGFKILSGDNGLYVNMPSAKTNKTDEKGDPIFQDTFHPISSDARQQIVNAVLDGYDAAIAKAQVVVKTAENMRRAPMKKSFAEQLREGAGTVAQRVAAPAPSAAKRTDTAL